MTREEFKNFIKAVERNSILREKVKSSQSINNLLSLAKEYNFKISYKDFLDDKISTKLNEWFETSRIAPIKR